jgi:hypothetical protein
MGHVVKDVKVLGKGFSPTHPSNIFSEKVVEEDVGGVSLHASSVARHSESNHDPFGSS